MKLIFRERIGRSMREAGKVAAVVAVSIAALSAAQAQENKPDAAGDGWFTEAQVERGKQLYNNICAACHGDEVFNSHAGTEETAQNVADMIIGMGMPADNPGGLPAQDYIDIAAYFIHGEGGMAFGPEVLAGSEEAKIARRTAENTISEAPAETPVNPAEAQAAESGEGWFTEAQVQRGEELYNSICAACHGSDIYDSWSGWEDSAQDLVDTIISLGMPANNPGGLPAQDYIDIAGYIMHGGGGMAYGPEVVAGTESARQARRP